MTQNLFQNVKYTNQVLTWMSRKNKMKEPNK